VLQTFISIQELIPTALKYDPNNKVTSVSIIAGMVVMAASLLLFTI
jgi:zinc transporter, ZIP family